MATTKGVIIVAPLSSFNPQNINRRNFVSANLILVKKMKDWSRKIIFYYILYILYVHKSIIKLYNFYQSNLNTLLYSSTCKSGSKSLLYLSQALYVKRFSFYKYSISLYLFENIFEYISTCMTFLILKEKILEKLINLQLHKCITDLNTQKCIRTQKCIHTSKTISQCMYATKKFVYILCDINGIFFVFI